jgi:Na+-driven multidrug efflux pump
MGVAFLAMGEAVGIMMGHILGAGELDDAMKKAYRMRTVTVVCGLVFGVVMAIIAPFFPLLYNTSDVIRHLATNFIFICSIMMPFCSYTHASYFIMRSGGNAVLTVIFDSVYTWVLVVPLAFCLSHFTNMGVTWMLFIVHGMEIVKCTIAFFFVRSGIWVKNIVK